MQRRPIQAQIFQLAMRVEQNRSARVFINAAGLHADDTVLDDVDDADAVCAAQFIELPDNVCRLHFLAIDGNRDAFFKIHRDGRFFVRSFFRSDAEHEHVIVVGFICRIFQLKAFVTDVPQVAVAAVAVGMVEGKIDALALAVFDFIFTGLELPDVGHAPRSDDADVRSQGLDAELETDLVISLAGCAVADRGRVFLAGNFDQLLGDGRTCHRRAEEIFIFIDSTCFDARHDVVFREVVGDVFNIKLGGTGELGAFLKTVQLASLAAVHAAADDVVVEILF